ncbi:CPCC family cysteine-rich protein [Paenibacillus sp. ACRRX]|uniref:CPCC family cysteine-rich protein n=1 Tax=Paenibacillus sp. ACRRX TaxID=2918206 RepID=UPI0031BB3C3A
MEELFSCPCCGFKTLTELYDRIEGTGYEICPYCNWQDDGTSDINSYRSINKGSIVDYRNELRINSNKYYTNKWLDGKG